MRVKVDWNPLLIHVIPAFANSRSILLGRHGVFLLSSGPAAGNWCHPPRPVRLGCRRRRASDADSNSRPAVPSTRHALREGQLSQLRRIGYKLCAKNRLNKVNENQLSCNVTLQATATAARKVSLPSTCSGKTRRNVFMPPSFTPSQTRTVTKSRASLSPRENGRRHFWKRFTSKPVAYEYLRRSRNFSRKASCLSII